MKNAGYSGTRLVDKLGIREHMKVKLFHAPAAYISWLERDISAQLCGDDSIPDFIHVFADNKETFMRVIGGLKPQWQRSTAIVIWVSWYKKQSGIATDLNEDIIRNYALANGLVDVKVCAVTHEWSGLKLVVPLALRKKNNV